jgi:hypothetical protein
VPLTTDPVFPMPTFSVEPWPDPVIDELGHDPRSAYVERFWLPVLGPSTVWFLRRVADHLDQRPDGFELDLVDTARSLGVGMRGGRNSPMLKTIERSCRFGAARMQGATALAVRRRLAPLTRAQVERLPEPLREEHGEWASRPRPAPTVEQMKDRARALALSMLELGEGAEAVERQLHRWRFHPAVAHDAVRWAVDAHRRAGSVPVAGGPGRSMAVVRPPRPPLPRPGRPGTTSGAGAPDAPPAAGPSLDEAS